MNLAEAVFEQNASLLKQVQLLEDQNGHPAVHKFGGSSLQSAAHITQVANIIGQNCQSNDLVIVSAMGDTTDYLFELVNAYRSAEHSEDQDSAQDYVPDCSAIAAYQQAIITQLLPETVAAPLIAQLNDDIQRITFLLSRSLAWHTLNQDDVISYGELWSTRVVTATLNHQGIDCQRVDSRDFIFTATEQQGADALNDSGDSAIDWQKSEQAFARWHQEFGGTLAVVSGYIASDHQGNTVTLGRNGSDFSATIVAKLAVAKMVYLWTDVDGVYSADPHRFSDTKVIPVLGLNEAKALANLGSPVFHQKTLKPLQAANIPIRIRNAQLAGNDQLNASPDSSLQKGTLILTQPVKWQGAKTIAAKTSVSLFKIQWQDTLLDVELNEQLASLLAHQHLPAYCWLAENQTLQFCVGDSDKGLVEQALAKIEVAHQLSVRSGLSVISLVGSELLQQGEHLAAYFSLIEQSGQSVLLYHYDNNGAISAVIDDSNPTALVSSIHQAIFVEKPHKAVISDTQIAEKVLSLVLFGYGNIGAKVIDILAAQLDKLNSRSKTHIQLVAVANSRNYIFNPQGLELNNADCTIEQQLADSTLQTVDIEESLALITDQQVAILDVTASENVADLYQGFFSQGRHIVSACKLGITFASERYEQLLQLAQSNNSRWLSNVTCGAGLPIQQTISDLVTTGDQINEISGLLSGTLSWILDRYDGQTPFSSVVAQAKALGFTEPDPRDDLSGKDVQRKLLIIARTMGVKLDLEQIALTPLIPAHLLELSVEAFAAASDELDQYMLQKWQYANEQGMKLCYSGQLAFSHQSEDAQLTQASVGLSFRDANDPLVNVTAADNIVVIKSDWHDSNPLIIRGPGAGINVTAAGIVADVIKLID
ncbi:MAG: aspartokinase/homoserine dehydrogenase 2 [Phenylobacterium sp.]|jgi:aspartokinase/homoserine dehydrogenase 2